MAMATIEEHHAFYSRALTLAASVERTLIGEERAMATVAAMKHASLSYDGGWTAMLLGENGVRSIYPVENDRYASPDGAVAALIEEIHVRVRRHEKVASVAKTKSKPDESKITLNLAESAAVLGISRGLLSRLVDAQRIRPARAGRRLIFSRESLERFLAGEVGP